MSSIGHPLMKQFINIFALVGLVASFATCGSTTKKVELAQCNSVRATSMKCRMKREMIHQMSSDILGYISYHRSRYS